MVLCREAEDSTAMCCPNLLEQRYIITTALVQPAVINCMVWILLVHSDLEV